MKTEIAGPLGGVPSLLVRTQGSDRTLQAGRSYHIGRDPESDIVVPDSRVSWRHAVLRMAGQSWLLEDTGSTNGTYLGTQRVQRIEITSDCSMRLGHPEDGPTVSCSIAAAAPASPAAFGFTPSPAAPPAATARRAAAPAHPPPPPAEPATPAAEPAMPATPAGQLPPARQP